MKVFNYQQVPLEETEGGAKGLKVRRLITEQTGAKDFAMRMFRMESNGPSPLHNHPWEHEVFVLEG